MRKIFALVCCLLLCFAFSLPVLAVEISDVELSSLRDSVSNLNGQFNHLVYNILPRVSLSDSERFEVNGIVQEISSSLNDLSDTLDGLSDSSSSGETVEVDLASVLSDIQTVEQRLTYLTNMLYSSGSSVSAPPTSSLDSAPEHTEGLPAVLVELFGEYQPRTQTDGDVTSAVPGLAGVDWPWIASAVLFSICVFCVFRLIGGIFKWT